MNVLSLLANVISIGKAFAGLVLFQCAIAAALSIGHILTAPFKKLLATMSKVKRKHS